MSWEWTPETEAQLRAWWDGGKSASEIVTAFARLLPEAPPTRNGVIGKAHRMKLAKRASPIRPRSDKPKPAPSARPAPPPAGPGILDLTPSMCRWPHGHPHQPATFHFCGAKAARPGVPYCAEHMERAYAKPGRKEIDGRTPEGKAALAEMLGEIVPTVKPSTHAQKMARARHAKALMFGRGA